MRIVAGHLHYVRAAIEDGIRRDEGIPIALRTEGGTEQLLFEPEHLVAALGFFDRLIAVNEAEQAFRSWDIRVQGVQLDAIGDDLRGSSLDGGDVVCASRVDLVTGHGENALLCAGPPPN